MGLFTRKEKGDNGARPRPSVSGEAQAAELRARARRRLAGAVVLVLAAVIILPMVLDSQPVPVVDDISVRIPGRDTPYQPTVSEPQGQPQAQQTPASTAEPASVTPAVSPTASNTTSGASTSPTAATTPIASATTPTSPATTAIPATPTAANRVSQPAATSSASTVTPIPIPDAPAQRPVVKPDAKPSSKPAESKPETRQPPARSDDGLVALALLEGRQPTPGASASAAAANKKGGFALQIAAYGSQADAQARNDQLREKGVTSAYIERINSGGKVLYRLRVGPFASREVAQAQQARLRALGYDATMMK